MTSKVEGLVANHLIVSGTGSTTTNIELIFPLSGTIVVEEEMNGTLVEEEELSGEIDD